MTVNDRYAQLYTSEPASELRLKRLALRKEARQKWEEAIAAENKRLYPRKRKSYPPLPDEFYDALRAEILSQYDFDGLDAEIDALEAKREGELDNLASEVSFAPSEEAFYLVKVSHTSSYSSQGYGVYRYARGALLPLQEKLKRLGFETHIRYVVTWTNPNAQYSCQTNGGEYELWANCPEWMSDAAKRTMSLSEALATLDKHAINPRVFNPFLPYEVTR